MRKVGKEEFMERIKNEGIIIEKAEEDSRTKSLVDLNQVLFNQLEKLNKEYLSAEELNNEVVKTNAIVNVSQTIINNAKVLLDADKHFMNQSQKVVKVLTAGDYTNVIQ